MRSMDSLRAAVLAGVLAGAAGCTVYEVAPGTYVSARRCRSLIGRGMRQTAPLQDQGVQISVEDRAIGTIRGRRGGIDVTASMRSQADGSVRVQFDSSGATAQNPGLIQRISSAYDRRTGRWRASRPRLFSSAGPRARASARRATASGGWPS